MGRPQYYHAFGQWPDSIEADPRETTIWKLHLEGFVRLPCRRCRFLVSHGSTGEVVLRRRESGGRSI